MAPFDGKTKVSTRVGIGEDAWKPQMGSLRKGPMTEEALVHGSKKEQIDMNLLSTVLISRTYQTNANFQCTVGAMRQLQDNNYLHTTLALYKRDVMGPTCQNHVGPTNMTYVTPLVENHSSPRMVNEPVSRMIQVVLDWIIAHSENSMKVFVTQACLVSLQAVGAAANLIGGSLDVIQFKKEFTIIQFAQRTFEFVNSKVKIVLRLIKNVVGLLRTATETMVSKLKFAINSIFQ